MTTVTMQAPDATYTSISTRNGNTYHSDNSGIVTGVETDDVVDLLKGGYQVVAPGYSALKLPLLNARNSDGSVIAAAASSGKFGISINAGTALALVSQAANASTITDTVVFEIDLPPSFPEGRSPSIIVNQNHVIGSGTLGAHTVAVHAYPISDAGAESSDVVTTSAQNTTASATDLTFITNVGSLAPGDRLHVSAVMTIVETGTQNVTGKINSIRLA